MPKGSDVYIYTVLAALNCIRYAERQVASAPEIHDDDDDDDKHRQQGRRRRRQESDRASWLVLVFNIDIDILSSAQARDILRLIVT